MKEKRNDITELVFILDRSGSMAGLESDTIGGFNGLVERQKQQEGRCFVTTVLFDHESVTLHDRVPLEKLAPMTNRDYTVRGCTALLDAVGDTIRHVASIHRYARPEDVPAHTLFVITTDGMENASRKYTAERIRRMISHEEKKYGWEFLFLGANIDAVATAKRYGIRPTNAVDYNADRIGTDIAFRAVSEAVGCVRASAPLAASWSDSIRKDHSSRKQER